MSQSTSTKLMVTWARKVKMFESSSATTNDQRRVELQPQVYSSVALLYRKQLARSSSLESHKL